MGAEFVWCQICMGAEFVYYRVVWKPLILIDLTHSLYVIFIRYTKLIKNIFTVVLSTCSKQIAVYYGYVITRKISEIHARLDSAHRWVYLIYIIVHISFTRSGANWSLDWRKSLQKSDKKPWLKVLWDEILEQYFYSKSLIKSVNSNSHMNPLNELLTPGLHWFMCNCFSHLIFTVQNKWLMVVLNLI